VHIRWADLVRPLESLWVHINPCFRGPQTVVKQQVSRCFRRRKLGGRPGVCYFWGLHTCYDIRKFSGASTAVTGFCVWRGGGRGVVSTDDVPGHVLDSLLSLLSVCFSVLDTLPAIFLVAVPGAYREGFALHLDLPWHVQLLIPKAAACVCVCVCAHARTCAQMWARICFERMCLAVESGHEEMAHAGLEA
jgi:hypothetical protein